MQNKTIPLSGVGDYIQRREFYYFMFTLTEKFRKKITFLSKINASLSSQNKDSLLRLSFSVEFVDLSRPHKLLI